MMDTGVVIVIITVVGMIGIASIVIASFITMALHDIRDELRKANAGKGEK